MSAETEEAPDAQTSGTNRGVSNNDGAVTSQPETVIHGRDGRNTITFGLPAPEAPEPEPVDNRPH